MKKKAFLLIIMCLAVALCMVMASCEKKDDNKNNPAAPATSASVAEGTNKDSDAIGATGEEGTSKPTSFPSIDPSSEVTFDILYSSRDRHGSAIYTEQKKFHCVKVPEGQ